MNTLTRIGPFIVVCVLAACGPRPDPVDPAPSDPDSAGPAPVDPGPEASDPASEPLGELVRGMTAEAVAALLGEPAVRGEIVETAADGLFHQSWEYPAAGLFLDLTSAAADGGQTLESISCAACALRTARGIGLGSTEAEVTAAYAGTADADFTRPGEQFVAGSYYGGIVFQFADGRVTAIFIGAAAE